LGRTTKPLIWSERLTISVLRHGKMDASAVFWAEAFWARPEEEVMRDLVFPEEERARWTTAKWDGGYRWFKSPNVICLEKARKAREAKWSG
jgi:hypothetical protein